MKQREILEFDLKPGLAIEFDNGDRGVVEVDGNNRYVLQTARYLNQIKACHGVPDLFVS